MDLSKLSTSEKRLAVAAAVVVVSSLISIAVNWGALMWIPLLAGVAVLFVIFRPQVMPSASLPGSTGSLIVALGAVATLVWVVVLLDQMGFVLNNPINLDTWQFLIGLASAAYIAWQGWAIVQAEGGRLRFGSGTGESTAAAGDGTSQAAPSEPMTTDSASAYTPPPAASEPEVTASTERPADDAGAEDRVS